MGSASHVVVRSVVVPGLSQEGRSCAQVCGRLLEAACPPRSCSSYTLQYTVFVILTVNVLIYSVHTTSASCLSWREVPPLSVACPQVFLVKGFWGLGVRVTDTDVSRS